MKAFVTRWQLCIVPLLVRSMSTFSHSTSIFDFPWLRWRETMLLKQTKLETIQQLGTLKRSVAMLEKWRVPMVDRETWWVPKGPFSSVVLTYRRSCTMQMDIARWLSASKIIFGRNKMWWVSQTPCTSLLLKCRRSFMMRTNCRRHRKPNTLVSTPTMLQIEHSITPEWRREVHLIACLQWSSKQLSLGCEDSEGS